MLVISLTQLKSVRSSLADDEIISEEKNELLKMSKSHLLLDLTDDESYFKSLNKLDEKLSDETEGQRQSLKLVEVESLSDERIKTVKTIITSKKPAKLNYTKTLKPIFSTSTKSLLNVKQTTHFLTSKSTILTKLTTRLKASTPVTKAKQKTKPKSELDQYLLQQDELKTCKENSRNPEVLGELTYKIFLRIKFPDVCQEPCYRECIIVKCKQLKCNKFTD